MKALLQAGPSGRVPAPSEKRFLISFYSGIMNHLRSFDVHAKVTVRAAMGPFADCMRAGRVWRFAAVFLFVAATARAQYTCTTNDGSITITKYAGSGGVLAITNRINGLPVTGIGPAAFYNCTNLTSVTIPDSVTYVGYSAFQFCQGMTNVTIPNSVTNMGHRTFFWCTSLPCITIPSNVTEIGYQAFLGCSSLTNISVDTGNSSYGSADGVLFNKDWTTLIQCPGGKAGSYIIPDGVTDIGEDAFSGYYSGSSLTNVWIPASVAAIGGGAFMWTTSLTGIDVDTNNLAYSSIDGVLFTKDQRTLIQFPGGREGTYTIPDGVLNVEDDAFCGCGKLIGVTIPSSVTNIGAEVFWNCYSLTTITIPASVTHIGSWVFDGCTNLTGVYFWGNVPSGGSSALNGSGATVYHLPGSTGWETFAYSPTVLWNPQVLPDDGNFGVRDNCFGFTFTNGGSPVIVVEACTNLVSPDWSPLATNTLTGGSSYFSDPKWTNAPCRFYRFRSP